MAPNTYGDLLPGSRRVGMMLRNLSAYEVKIPLRTAISNVQAAKIVPNMKASIYTSEVLPSMEQMEPSWVGQPSCLTPQTELTQLIPVYLQLESSDPSSCDVLNKVDLSGCSKWDPKDNQEVRIILREYADVFAKDNLYMGQTSIVKHKITLKEGTKLIKGHRRIPPGLYDELQKQLQEIINVGAI